MFDVIVTGLDVEDGDHTFTLPPAGFIVSVDLFIVQDAWRVRLPFGVYDAPPAPALVPDSVYHPPNVYPVFVGVGRVTLEYVDVCVWEYVAI